MLTRTSWSRSSFSRPKVPAKLIPTGGTILSGNTRGEHRYVFQCGYQTRSIRAGQKSGALGFGTAINIALQVGELQLTEWKPLAERGDQVLEVQSDPLDGAIFQRLNARRKVAIAETGECEFPRFGGYFLQVSRWLVVELDELDDINAGRQFDQPLLKPHQQVINLCCLARGFLS